MKAGRVARRHFTRSAILFVDAGRMNALALGEEGAESLGVAAEAVKKRILIAASLNLCQMDLENSGKTHCLATKAYAYRQA